MKMEFAQRSLPTQCPNCSCGWNGISDRSHFPTPQKIGNIGSAPKILEILNSCGIRYAIEGSQPVRILYSPPDMCQTSVKALERKVCKYKSNLQRIIAERESESDGS